MDDLYDKWESVYTPDGCVGKFYKETEGEYVIEMDYQYLVSYDKELVDLANIGSPFATAKYYRQVLEDENEVLKK